MQAGDRVRCIKPRGHDHLAISGVGEVVAVRGNLVRVQVAHSGAVVCDGGAAGLVAG